uniref:Helicase domino n=1 Tax=Anisakis simplex TaxID=6269 RepID=A0A0M3JKP1_ANISI
LVSTVDSQRKSLTAKFLENKQQQQQQEQQSVIKAADSSEIETDEETHNESNDVKQADVHEDDDDDRVNPFDIWKSRVDGGETPAVPTNKSNDHHGSLVQTTIEKFSRQV